MHVAGYCIYKENKIGINLTAKTTILAVWQSALHGAPFKSFLVHCLSLPYQ